MFTHRKHDLKRAAHRPIGYCPIHVQHGHLENNFKTKSDQNIHQNTLNCRFSSKYYWRKCMPRITLACVQQ